MFVMALWKLTGHDKLLNYKLLQSEVLIKIVKNMIIIDPYVFLL